MKRTLATVAVAAAQLALAGLAVAPQLSARVAGDTYLMRVAPLDPIDPFRGAYVSLGYPGLQHNQSDAWGGEGMGSMEDGESGDVYITLRPDGEGWVADEWLRSRPDGGPYLSCDDRNWQIRCGIDSFFLPQDEALEMEEALSDGAWAEVRIDSRGNAAVVDVRETP